MTQQTWFPVGVTVAALLIVPTGVMAGPHEIPGQYIVELKPGVDPDVVSRAHGVAPLHRYTIINGFAARMPDRVVQRLAADGRVEAISADLVVHAFIRPPATPAPGTGRSGRDAGAALSPTEVLTPEAQAGVRRIGAEAAWAKGYKGTGVKVAVIDTGIDCTHPDLAANCKGGVNLLASGQPAADDHGHGTHLAGIIAARQDNGFGVAGVAPEAWLYRVKVLDGNGSGALSTVIKGIDWAAANGMNVANLSLGAFDFSLGTGPMCRAVRRATLRGITVVAAAGNSAFEALFFTPANCQHSLTGSAFVESDGVPGGFGALIDSEADDTFAETFSNYSNYCYDLDADGSCTEADAYVVDLMAPAVAVLSTCPTYAVTLNQPPYNAPQSYCALTGTSMAAPHMAGAAALLIGRGIASTPAHVRIALTTNGSCTGGVTDTGTGGSNTCPEPWADDYDLAWEPLLAVGWVP